MVARQYRFHGYNALKFVYQTGKTARTSSVLLRYGPNPRRQKCRVAVVVGKKVHKSAVVRNRIRRRLYASIRTAEIDGKGIGDWPAFDLVFTVVNGDVGTVPEKTNKNTIYRLLQISGLGRQAVEK